MKKNLILLILLTLISTSLQACAPSARTEVPTSETGPGSSEPVVSTIQAEVGATDLSTPFSLQDVTASPSSSSSDGFFTGDVTLMNQGQTITLHVGDSFLLNLVTDQYNWTVSVDN